MIESTSLTPKVSTLDYLLLHNSWRGSDDYGSRSGLNVFNLGHLNAVGVVDLLLCTAPSAAVNKHYRKGAEDNGYDDDKDPDHPVTVVCLRLDHFHGRKNSTNETNTQLDNLFAIFHLDRLLGIHEIYI